MVDTHTQIDRERGKERERKKEGKAELMVVISGSRNPMVIPLADGIDIYTYMYVFVIILFHWSR